MLMSDDLKDSKPLNDVIRLVVENAVLQTHNVDVGIPFICGAPGGGKTASIKSLCDVYGFGVLSTHLALKPLEEIGGIPQFEKVMINGQEILGTIWSFPDIMKELHTMAEKHSKIVDGKEQGCVVWLLDDSHLLSAVHMAILYELLTERTLRSYKLPQNVAIVMAGNTSNKSGAKTMFSAIVNRCCLMPVYTDFTHWKVNYAMKNNVHPAILSFLSNLQYQKFFHEEEQVDKAWGSPRSWTRFAGEITNRENWYKKNMEIDNCLYLGTGYVGKEAASEFVTYYKIFSEFDIDHIFANYSTYDLPSESVRKYALAFALTNYYIGKEDREKSLGAMAHLISLFMNNSPDLSVMMIKEMSQLEKSLGKKNIIKNIITQIQKIDPILVRNVLKDVSELNLDFGS